MTDSYEDVLADVQSEIIAAALEYSGPNVEEVFVYLSTERLWHMDVFYRQGERIVSRVQLRDVEVSVGRQRSLMLYVRGQLERLVDAAHDAHQPAPTEARLIYNVQSGGLRSTFRYEPRDLADDESEHGLVDRWKESEQATL